MEGNHRTGKGERPAECGSLHFGNGTVRGNVRVQRHASSSSFEGICAQSLQVILWLKMEFVLAPNLTSFALLLVHLPSCICHGSRDLPTLIHPECAPETWARPCESFSAATLLGCWDPSQALQRLQCLPPTRLSALPRPPLQPPSPGCAAALTAFELLASQARTWLFISLASWRRRVESSSARHLPCSAIHTLSSHWGLLRMPHAKMQLLSTLKSTLCFCLFKFYICFTFPFCWYYPLKCKCQSIEVP